RALGLSPRLLSFVYAHPRSWGRRPLRRTPPILENATPAQILHLLPGPGASRRAPFAALPPRGTPPASRPRLDRLRSRGPMGRRLCRRGHGRRPAPCLQIESRSQGENVPRRPLELLAPSQLFLRMAHLGRLCARRARRALGLARPLLP